VQKRPICNVEGCNNLAEPRGEKHNGEYRYFRKVCASCRKKQRGQRPIGSKIRRHFKETPEGLLLSPPFGKGLDTRRCMYCGWDKGPCDRHHKKDGTLISLCPNCHRLITLKILDENLLDSL